VTGPSLYARAKSLFFDACDIAPEKRTAFLDQACGGDAALRAEVDSLLAHHAENEVDAWDPAAAVRSLAGAAVETDDRLLGARLAGRYDVVDELGSGGMGCVYLATDRRFDRTVAVKALYFTSDLLREAFEREARLLNDLRHRALPVVIDYFAEQNGQFLVMDYVPGRDLADALAARLESGAGPFPLADVARWTDGLLDALAYLHGHEPPVVHRDVKPQNLKLTPMGEVVLLDFGLAMGAVAASPAAPASVAGYTPNYAPLEQIQGTGTDPRSDLYALGATLYHLLTGVLPPDARLRAEAILEGRRDPLVAAHELNAAVPRALSSLLRTTMALTKTERPASAAALRDAFAAAMRTVAGPSAREDEPAGEVGTPNNLPAQATRFVGRARDVATIAHLAAAARLVTLAGPGGIGKTRLALEAAAASLDDYPDGVWLVELASLIEPSLVAGAVALAVGVRETEAMAGSAALVAALGERHSLVVLDNCEHVVDACAALVGDVVRSCPGIHVLATSRQPLGVDGEAVWPVPPLSLPDPDSAEGSAADSDAVALFVERARAAKPAFSPGADAAVVARICRRLEGIPLAIELAAARVRVLALEQIDARLEDRFRLLTGGDPAVAERHQTLRAAVDWSYELLDGEERALLRRMSLFPAGCTLEAAEAVCAGDGVPKAGVLDAVARLVDRSLVSVDERAGEARYRLLETIREYGAERLAEAGEEVAAARRLLVWAVELAARTTAGILGPSQRASIARLEAEHDNLRAALALGLGGEPPYESSLRLATHLVQFWHFGGYAAEGCATLERALVQSPDAPAAERVDALKGAGTLANALGDYRRARAHYEAGLAIARTLDDPVAVGRLVSNIGFTAYLQGEYTEAEALLGESLAIFRGTGNERLISLALNNLATLLYDRGETDRSVPLYEESLALKRRLGDGIGTATLLYNLGIVAQTRGDGERSRRLLEESLALRREAGDKQGVAIALGRLARADIACGDTARCETLLAEAIGLNRKLGDRLGLAETLESAVCFAGHREEWERALGLYGAAAGLREAIGSITTPADAVELERTLAAARRALGDERAARVEAAGRAMSDDEAIRYAHS
jgi:non-specific serine/threonine protein kinase